MIRNAPLFCILVLAFTLRVFSLSSFPIGFTPDEASFGYDAYSILKTGKDQWGHTLPLVLESFGDYKAPLYAYVAIPFVWILGLSKVAVRLPNAVLGTAAIWVTFLLTQELLDYRLRVMDSKKSTRETLTHNKLTALVAALLLAISPWHISMSRGAFEANLTTFFLPLGIMLFLKGLKERKYLLWSVVVLGINLFTYHSARLVTPIVVVSLTFLFRRELVKVDVRQKLLVTGVFVVFVALSLYTLVSGGGARVAERSIYEGSLIQASGERFEAIQSGTSPFVARLLHNKYEVTLRRFLANYIQYISPRFLFLDGPTEATYGMLPGSGVLLWPEVILLGGSFLAFLHRKDDKPFWLVICWLFIAFFPAAMATGRGYSANRAVIALPAIQILLALGAIELHRQFKKRHPRELLVAAISIFVIVEMVSLLKFSRKYFVESSKIAAKQMLYGNLEISEWLTREGSGKKTLLSRSLSEPHIYIAFSHAWDPVEYQRNSRENWDYKSRGVSWVDQMPEYSLGRYVFKNIDWEIDSLDNGGYWYIIGKPEEFPAMVNPVLTIWYPNKEPAIFVVDPTIKGYAYTN